MRVGGANHSHATQVGCGAAGRAVCRGATAGGCVPRPGRARLAAPARFRALPALCWPPLLLARPPPCPAFLPTPLLPSPLLFLSSQDLYEAIQRGEYPEWQLLIQTMDPAVSAACCCLKLGVG